MRNHESPSTNPPNHPAHPPNPQSPIPNPRPSPSLYAAVCRPAGGGGDELIAIARDFSPRFQIHSADLVVIDVSGLGRLLGPARAIGDELRSAVARRGIRAHVAIASTQTAAMVLAHTRPGVTVVTPGSEAPTLAPVAIGIVERLGRLTSDVSDLRLQTFQQWGIHTLGDLAALPDAELVSRFGRQAMTWQMIARGVDRRPLIPALDEERFEGSIELEWPIEGLEPLSFVLTRLLEPLCTRLERRDRGAAVVHVLLDLVNNGAAADPASAASGAEAAPGARGFRAAYSRRLELPTPMRDVRALRTLVLLDLESHPPAAAVDAVTIVVDPTPGRVLQHTLFTRPLPTPEQLSTLLARLGAVMGQDRVGAPAVLDTYRPGALAMRPFPTDHAATCGTSEVFALQTSPGSALRRCRQPVPARIAVGADGSPVRVTSDRRGYAGGAVVHAAGPWKTSGNWWMTETARSAVGSQKSASLPQTASVPLPTSCWDRDEWDVSLGDGAVYRIFRDRATDAWYIDAIID